MHRAQPPTLAHQRNTHGTSNSRPLLSSFTSCLFFPLLFFSPSSVRWHEGRRESQEAARFNLFIPRSLLISSLISLPPSSFWLFLLFSFFSLLRSPPRLLSRPLVAKEYARTFQFLFPAAARYCPNEESFQAARLMKRCFDSRFLVNFPRPGRYVDQKRK